MPDTLDDLSQQYLNPQLWNLPQQPAPGTTHEAPKPDPVAGAIQGFEHGGIQTAIEGAGAQPPEWLTHINDFLTQNKGAIDTVRQLSEGLPGPGNIGMLKAVPMAGRHQLDMLQLAKDEFPEATTVLGGRATGATRGKPSRPKPLPEQTTYEKTPKTPEFLELERELGRIARESIAEHGRSPPGSLNLTPTQSPLRTPPLPRDPNDIENLLRLIFNPNR